MTVAVFPGKFLPPHRGHLTGILRAHALCDRLYVAISESPAEDGRLCQENELSYISGAQRQRWLLQELRGFDIQVCLVDERTIPPFPHGWKEYAELLRAAVPEPFQVIFGGELSYREGHERHFPGVEYRVLDPHRTKWPISASEIRRSPFEHWDYIVGAARPFFTKRVLITGPESCGKTTMTRKLAKTFYTSWSEELGRDYQVSEAGGADALFELEDFNRIAHLQYEQDQRALRSANRVCFFDTDAVVTHYFSEFFLGKVADRVDSFIDPKRYDLVIALKPTVPWVDDGLRDTSDPGVRSKRFEELMALYRRHGFDTDSFLVVDSADYYERLEICIQAVESLIAATPRS